MNKRKAERRHARRRAMERYGVDVGDSTRRAIVAAIQANRSTPVRTESLSRTIHDVTLSDGLVVRVVYDRRRKELVTFLTPPARVRRQGLGGP